MKVHSKILFAFTLSMAAAIQAGAQDKKMTQAEEMAMMADMMKPTAHHEAMKADAGDWVTKSQFWMSPDAPPMVVEGTCHIELIMNGLFITEVSKADMMGMPWEGRGTFGYDSGLKKHVGSWHDSMGPILMDFKGDCDGACKVVTMYSDFYDPMSAGMKRMKSVTKNVDATHRVNELYIVDEKGIEMKMGVIEYSKK